MSLQTPHVQACIASHTTLAYIVRGTVVAIYCIVTIFFNCLQIVVTQRVTSFSDNTRILMTSLALSDIGVGFLAVSSLFISVFVESYTIPSWLCHVAFAWFYTCTSRSVVDLMMLSVDRFVAVTKPLRYPTILPQHRVKLITLILWVFIVTLGVTTSLINTVEFNECVSLCVPKLPRSVTDSVLIFIMYYVLPLVIIFGMNMKLCQLSSMHVKKIQASIPLSEIVENSVSSTVSRRIVQRQPTNGNRKSAYVVAFVTLGFALTWIAYYVMILVSTFGGPEASEWIQFTVVWLALSNSWLNVIIYALFYRAFRETAHKFIVRCGRCFQP
ncbi:histamine H2 receptor-like [Asterias amurensis]|uniref:histamine H2 receptor-like n=1 Tax=Asterias amurensis TaxID=7602 RepID=UPI003AB4EEF5